MTLAFYFGVMVVILHAAQSSYTLAFPCGWMSPLPESVFPRITDASAKNIIFVTDGTNFDDALVLFYLAKSPKANLVAIYITPNAWASAAPSYRHMRNTLYMMGDTFASIPIYIGSHYALIDELDAKVNGGLPKYSYKWAIPTDDSGLVSSDAYFGQAYFLPESPYHFNPYTDTVTDEQSIPALAQYLAQYPSNTKFSVLSTGALSMLAKLFTDSFKPLFEPLFPQLEELVVMGGAVNVSGNVFSVPGNSKAEFNIYADPHAAHWAMANFSSIGSRVVLVPLDATNDVPITESFLDVLVNEAKTPEAQLAGRMLLVSRDTWFDPALFHQYAYLWDPTAAIIMLHPESIDVLLATDLRVIYQQGPEGPSQAKTKECSGSEFKSGLCFKCSVVSKVDPILVENQLVNAFQNKTNSAKRALTCPYGKT